MILIKVTLNASIVRPSAGGLVKAQEAVWVKELPPRALHTRLAAADFPSRQTRSCAETHFTPRCCLPSVSGAGPHFNQSLVRLTSVSVCAGHTGVDGITGSRAAGEHTTDTEGGNRPIQGDQSATNEMTAKEMAPPPSVSTRQFRPVRFSL